MGAVEGQDIWLGNFLGLHLTQGRKDDAFQEALGADLGARFLVGKVFCPAPRLVG